MAGWIILYDDDCGFCRWSVDVILRSDQRRALRAVRIQSLEADEVLSEIPRDRRLQSWHVRSPDGVLYSAGRAVPPLLRILPYGQRLSSMAEAFPQATDLLYRLVARNRTRLGALIGSNACAVDPSRGKQH